MNAFLTKSVAWFQGKKTFLGGLVTIAAAGAGVWFGKIDTATAVAVAGIGFSAIGLGAKANRHQAELLTAVQGVAQAGLDYRAGKSAQAVQDAEQAVAAIAAPLAIQGISGMGAAASASFHLTADSHAELLDAMQSLGGVLAKPGATATAAVVKPGLVSLDV